MAESHRTAVSPSTGLSRAQPAALTPFAIRLPRQQELLPEGVS